MEKLIKAFFIREKYEILFNIEQKLVLLPSSITQFQYYLILVLNYKGIVLFYACLYNLRSIEWGLEKQQVD